VSFIGFDPVFLKQEDGSHPRDVWTDADALHVMSEYLWKRAVDSGCPPSKPHAVIPPPVDCAFFDPGSRAHHDVTGSGDRPLRILSVGWMDWHKGYEYALEGLRRLVDGGIPCEYRIVGGGRL